MKPNYVFTATAGRTGTCSLAKLAGDNCNNALAVHEQSGMLDFGVGTPDISTKNMFNCRGNVNVVAHYWANKFKRIMMQMRTDDTLDGWPEQKQVYLESSHINCKAGLFENLTQLRGKGQVKIVELKRETVPTIASYVTRMDFAGKASQWLWYLDPSYPKNLVPFEPFAEYIDSPATIPFWYLCEMSARIKNYEMMAAPVEWVDWIKVDVKDLNDEQKLATLFDELGLRYEEIQIQPPSNTYAKQALSDSDYKRLLDVVSQDVERLMKCKPEGVELN